MPEAIIKYNELKGNRVTLEFDGIDYDIKINHITVVSTGDKYEAEMIAESIDGALSILNADGHLK